MLRKTSIVGSLLALVAGLAFGQSAPPAHAAKKTPVAARAVKPAAPTGPSLLAPLSDGETVPLPPLDEHLPRPEAVLGYPLGSRFTHWANILDYLKALAAASPRVKMWEYGRTYEGRPLELLAISTPANLARLDEIRQERLRLADPAGLSPAERERLLRRNPAVVWLAYGIHGNEPSSSEAAMATAYVLAAGQGETAELLANTVVLIDPLCNPDGHERYVHGYEERRGQEPNPERAAAEHWEPWPGGRQNHYVLDLNRDWAWATQQESRSRIAAYRAWEPQVYVDFHEMGTDSSYFFPPAAEPVHPRIDRRIVGWLEIFGRGNAEAFDRQGWVYFKNESFDLFYPGYGDSYPSLRGAVGMTYEVAGGGRSGLVVNRPDGTLLTLADRVARHLTTALATFRTAAGNSRRLLEDFVSTRLKAATEPGRTYLWPETQPEARALADLFALHGIQVQQLAQAQEVAAQPYLAKEVREPAPRRFAAGTYAVSTAQPLGNLVDALLAREAQMSPAFLERQRQRLDQNLEAEFYDITAWSLPLAYNLETWVAPGELTGLRATQAPPSGLRGSGATDLGYLVAPQGLASYRLAAALQAQGIVHRVALGALSSGGTEYPAGTLFIPRRNNPEALPETLTTLLKDDGLTAQALTSSYEVKGISLGSDDMARVRPVHVGLLSGEGVDATSFGSLWYLLDRQIGLPYSRLDIARLKQVSLADFDVLILPDGDYEGVIGDKAREALAAWNQSGGLLVAVGGQTVKWLQQHDLTAVKSWSPPAEDPESERTPAEKELMARPIFTPGAVLATKMRPHHPLTLGIKGSPAVLVEGSTVLKPFGDPQKDVLVAASENPVLAGFAWPEARERLAGALLVGSEPRGRGTLVLFVQDPAYRLFWRATMPLFLNAVLFGPSAGLGRN